MPFKFGVHFEAMVPAKKPETPEQVASQASKQMIDSITGVVHVADNYG